ncbi:MAG TPA: NAD(P)/FAD-dependent oxidoreductase [Acidocella sp.]|nr:NAD(P)/FAD-dependent oxidoreductase [Acidocella sp.]HQU03327.1 NAD(P)/FAD-dependent oxidoreductase [Acidocella sp.]
MEKAQQTTNAPAPPDCDVLVIGGGPAGSSVATLLAERGRRVVLLEKDKHPRFHIGESLLPYNLPLLDRLGVRAQIETSAQHKHGIEFVSPFHGKSVRYEFAKAWDKRFPYAFQVRRSAFDEILLRNASQKGAEVLEECRVTRVEFPENDHPLVTARQADGTEQQWRAAFIVDASGRDTVLASQMGSKARNPRNDSAAIYGHFTGARRLEGQAAGNITIVWFDLGWFWFIPLSDGTTSVGAVSPAANFKNRGTDLKSFFMGLIASSPEIADRLKHATLTSEVTATGNYSYSSSTMSGRNFILAGDACTFIDPVFSTGVYVAMQSGFWAADAVEACLTKPQRAAAILRRYDRTFQKALGSFTWFIYRIREPAMRNLFMSPRNIFRMEEAVLSLLAGGVFTGWQIKLRLYMFRAIYYATKLSHLRFRLTGQPLKAPSVATIPREVSP